MSQGIFSFEKGLRLKREGMARAATNRASLLKLARWLAVEIAESRTSRIVSMDDVQAALVDLGISDRALGNAAGSVFKGGKWAWTGSRIQSLRPHAHRNEIKTWRLV